MCAAQHSFQLFLWSEMLLTVFRWQKPIICSLPSVGTAISRLGRLRVSCWRLLVLVANHFLQMLTSVSFLLCSRRTWLFSWGFGSQQVLFSFALCNLGNAGDLFCTLFTIFHSVQHFVHYLYTIEAVHYWTCCWIRKKIQGI